ncbi:MAG TPA: glucuronate isomerase, partial [Lachnospiraceae bacterium]
KEPIIDFHNHLNPEEIYKDRSFDNMTQIWLGGDHYKWRAMRMHGISEELITGNAKDFDKFTAWAKTVQNLIGNPLYHWTHLELQRYFQITKPLTLDTAKEIWEECNIKLKDKNFSVRNILERQNVSVLCTTDDPADSLEWHQKIKEDNFKIKVLPSFRPEKAMGIEKEDYKEYIEKLSEVALVKISTVKDLLSALKTRLDFFITMGCKVSDHSLERNFYSSTNLEEVEQIFQKAFHGESLLEEEVAKFKGFLLIFLGKEYAKKDIVMQIHIGALRNNSERLYRALGGDIGCDSLHDFVYASQLSEILKAMDKSQELPKTLLYCLNPKDMEMLSAMAGNFCQNTKGIRGKVQLGAAWWFCDHKNGIEKQIDAVADLGLISASVGMLTDSRSFLSFPRHEYYRRILCNKVGNWVENGEYPADKKYLEKLIKDICQRNALQYFGF